MPTETKSPIPSSSTTKGARELREEVLDQGLCTACGMCLDLCPYLEELGENVAMISDCKGDQGRCYAVCPRTETNLDSLRDHFFPGWNSDQPDHILGPYESIWMSRARNSAVRQKSQYGGTVTALAMYGLETGKFDAALLTQWDPDTEERYLPAPMVARSPAEVLASTGSKYTACPTLKVLDKTLNEGVERLCIVSRPCQTLALRKRMQLDDASFRKERVALIVGLFCMWSLSYREFRQWLEPAIGANRIEKIDIPRGGFVVETEHDRVEMPHEELQAHARKTCNTCFDFTAELADLSVGSTEWKDDWNTLIVRSHKGRAFVEDAAEKGHIELEPFPGEREELLREASFNKKKRVLETLNEENRKNGRAPYLKLSKEEVARFLGEAGGEGPKDT